MEAPVAIREQVVALYRSMSRLQRCGLLCCAVLVGVGFFWILARPSASRLAPVLNGKTLTPDETKQAVERLKEAGLRDYEIVDAQLMVPEKSAAEYETVISRGDAGPRSWVETWRDANSSLSHFAVGRQREDAGEIARADLLSRLFAQLPGIDTAEIVWDEEPRSGWRRPPKVRATVYLKPQPGHEISLETVSAVRTAVAGSKAHLAPADVAVMDMQRMVTYSGEADDAAAGDAPHRLAQVTAAYRTRLEDALAHIAGVRISVVVTESLAPPRSAAPEASGPLARSNVRMELSPDDSAVAPESAMVAETSDVRDLSAAPEDHVSVSVSIPQSHFDASLAERLAGQTPVRATLRETQHKVEQAVVRDVRERVAAVLGINAEDDAMAHIKVSAHNDARVVHEPSASADDQALLSWIAGRLKTHRIPAWGLATAILIGALFAMYSLFRRTLLAFRPSENLVRDGESTPAPMPHGRSIEQGHGDAASADDSPEADRSSLPDGRLALDEIPISQPVTDAIAALPPGAERDALPDGAQADQPFETAGNRLSAEAGRPPTRPESETQDRWSEPGSRAAAGAEASIRHENSGEVRADRRLSQFASTRGRTAGIAAEAHPDIEQILRCDAESLCRLFHEIPSETWVRALVGASASVEEHMTHALPDVESQRLRQAVKSRRPVRLHDVESAQREILEGLALGLA